jgi:ADP-heptose:LPS heptosyltransferase
MAGFCQGLARHDLRIVLTGTEADLPLANELIQRLKNIKFINACAKTNINQLACLIKRCSVYVSCDSAPLHIACAMQIPFVALFGPTDPRRHLAPAKKFVLIKKGLPCSPCYKAECRHKECMELITAEEVLEAVGSLLR